MSTTFGKAQWVEMFETVGLDEDGRQRWHAEFEARWPEHHRRFLEWLGLPGDEIEWIRAAAREARARH